MAFATIHGIEVPIRDRTWKQSPIYVGDRRVRHNGGGLIDGRTVLKWSWSGATPVLDNADATAIIGLLNGDGHVFSFDVDIYSAKGLIWTGSTPTVQATNVKYGAKAGEILTATTSTISPGYSGFDQTVLVWRRPGAGSFDHYGITRTAAGVIAEVKNGVVGAFTTSNWITFGASSISLLGKNDAAVNTTIQVDDLVVLPFLLSTAQIQAVFAQTRAWADLPQLNCSGDGFNGNDRNYVTLGRVGRLDYVQAHSPLDGVWKLDNVVIDLSFEQV